MVRLGLVIIFMLLPFFVFADATEEQLKSFLQSREVIEQVYFESASKALTKVTREDLDSLVPRLKSLAVKGYLFRVEGFSSPEGDSSKNMNLSLYRAMAVRNYLKDQHDLNLDVFLTGFGGLDEHGTKEESRRVDIAIYVQPEAAAALFDDQGTIEKISLK